MSVDAVAGRQPPRLRPAAARARPRRVAPAQSRDALGALGRSRRRPPRGTSATRCGPLLVSRREDLAPFDEAFDAFWRVSAKRWRRRDLRALGEPHGRPRCRSTSCCPSGDAGPRTATPPRTTPSRATCRSAICRPTSARRGAARQGLRRLHRRRARAGAGADCGAGLDARASAAPGAGRPDAAPRSICAAPGRAQPAHGGELLRAADPRPRRSSRGRWCCSATSAARWSATRGCCCTSRTRWQRGPRRRRGVPVLDPPDAGHPRARPRLDRRGGRRACRDAVPDWSGGTRIGEALRTFNVALGAARARPRRRSCC